MASKKEQRRSERAEARAKKRRNQQIALGTIIIAVLAIILIFVFGRNNNAEDPGATTAGTGETITTATGLQYEDLVVGSGPAAKDGDTVSVHYTGWLEDGTKFDSSVDRGEPFPFTLGAGGVIPGWEEGVAGMQVGGKRRLIIPPDLGYGPQDYGPIPGNSTLIFEVELLEIK
ncbi:MAG TPA: FKBP-type peptidyl-prolyl cis-trans isomerase [Anaerolineales bacterium]|nr:FKBP-type peptidyl-prolyl cis-trans isomerase [Anaerolineales bacterium]